ncbi:MAG: MFS transporter [Deltaproteobacteria bacterium]|nr:MFS transporter [Deltaproteobacteria bacterium]
MTDRDRAQAGTAAPFPRVFWTANLTELFERSAYYSVASFVVIYLGQLGLGRYWPSTLSSSVLWGLIYFLPIVSGTVADHVGFRRALLVAFVMLAAGYFLMGAPVWLGLGTLGTGIGEDVTAGPEAVLCVVCGILLVGCGGSVIKPCISGTVQKVAGVRATLAFAIFYMVVNIGSVVGRVVGFAFRKRLDLSYIYAVGAGFCILAFFVVLFAFKDPDRGEAGAVATSKPRRSVGRILADMVLVLRNPRFSLFLLASSGFWFLYNQVYNVIPLYWKKVLEKDPAADLYTAANPLVIVFFQLAIVKLFGKMKPVRSMIVGNVIVGLAMLINLGPIWLASSIRAPVWGLLPVGSLVGIMTVALIAFGELFTSARGYEYIGALAPKGQEGLFLGYANLPVAIGALAGGPVGALVFNELMCRGATPAGAGLIELDPVRNSLGWIVFAAVGLATALLMWAFNRWLERQIAREATA